MSAFVVDIFEASNPWGVGGGSISAREAFERGADRVERRLADEPEARAAFLHTIGDVYHRLGLYEESAAFGAKALELRRRLLGGDHPDVAASLALVGVALGAQNKCEEAEALACEAANMSRRLIADDHPHLAASLRSLARMLTRRGSCGEARRDDADDLTSVTSPRPSR